MPSEFIGLITVEHFNTCMSLAGIASACVVLAIWSRGL